MKQSIPLKLSCLALLALFQGGCGDDPVDLPDDGNEEEVITTVTLTFTPVGGGDSIVATFDDPDGDGGDEPTLDDVALELGTTYNLQVDFENRLEDPAENITEEIADESDEHQLFFTGGAVAGPASDAETAFLAHAYADKDVNDLPVGLENTLTATDVGTGDFVVTLRHLPPENDQPVKVEGLEDMVKTDGFAAIGGDTDVQVNFEVTVVDEG